MSYLIQNGGIRKAAEHIVPIIESCLHTLRIPDNTSSKAKQASCYLLFLLARTMYKIADVIYEPFGIDILAHLDKFLDHKDTYLKREARQAYKEWKGLEKLKNVEVKDRGIFNFAELE